jgi:signal transduction histidine kinase/CheY-like chemotaxis protein
VEPDRHRCDGPEDIRQGESITDPLTLALEIVFALVFARALVEFIRRPDPLARDVVLVFSAMASIFVLEIIRRTIGPPPGFVSSASILLLLGQPFLTLRVVAHLRAVPGWWLAVAFVAFLVTSLPLVVLGQQAPRAVTLAAVAVFVVTELVAGGLLVLEAVRRAGSARFRLASAAIATILFAIAILAAGAGSAGPDAEVATAAARLLALLAALGYLVAFLPPGWLRHLWQAQTAYGYTQQLLEAGPTEGAPELWKRFSDAAGSVAGSDGAASIVPSATGTADVHVANLPPLDGPIDPAEIERIGSRADPALQQAPAAVGGLLAGLATSIGARFCTIVPITLRGARHGSVVLFARRRSLFSADDGELLTDLAGATALLAERQALLAEQRRLAEELAATVAALEQASQAKSDFMASMSHELRTPLNAIIGFSELMRDEPTEGDMVRVSGEWVEHINRSGQHLLGLINDVLDLTKVEAGRLDLQLEPVELGQAVAESVAGVRPLADRKRIALSVETQPGTISVDRGRLRQILYNVLSNAIKFTPEGGRVHVAATYGDGAARVTIQDSGIGIAPEDQPHVFEEFRQLGDPNLRQGGSGLGLALTRRLVEAHDGTIGFESEVGRGTTFSIELPVGVRASGPAGEPQPMPAAATLEGAEPVAPALGHGRPSVLVVEDDPAAVRLLRTYLESDGYAVAVAVDGESALDLAARSAPDAIILDVLLPGMDGWELLRRLKSEERLRDIPVIIVTVVDERDVGLALGAVDYFVKPVDRKALLDRLARYQFTTKVRQRPVRVLTVDDDSAALAMLDAALRPEGFTVVAAPRGRAALDLARDNQLDLVICDLLMPDLDGFGVVAALKAEPRTRDVPILILTAHELSASDKARLNGKILGVVGKGAAAEAGLREWLGRVAALPGGGATGSAADAASAS